MDSMKIVQYLAELRKYYHITQDESFLCGFSLHRNIKEACAKSLSGLAASSTQNQYKLILLFQLQSI